MPRWIRIALDAGKNWNADNAFKHSAAVSFYTLFSLAPITIIALGVAGFFFGQEAAQGQFANQMSQLVGKDSAELIQKTVAESQPHGSSWWSTAAGVVLLLFGATTVFGQLQDSINEIWGVAARPTRNGLVVMLVQRVVSFAMVLTVGFLLLVSLILSTAVTALVKLAHSGIADNPVILHSVDLGIGLIVITGLFMMVFKVMPDVTLRWSYVWRGALVTSLLFSIGRLLIALYLGHSTVASTYGAAGSLVALLVWVYYSCAILFYGVEFTRSYCSAHDLPVHPKATAIRVKREMVEEPASKPAREKSPGARAAG